MPRFICGDCGTYATPLHLKESGRRVYKCDNPYCGKQFIRLNGKSVTLRYAPSQELAKTAFGFSVKVDVNVPVEHLKKADRGALTKILGDQHLREILAAYQLSTTMKPTEFITDILLQVCKVKELGWGLNRRTILELLLGPCRLPELDELKVIEAAIPDFSGSRSKEIFVQGRTLRVKVLCSLKHEERWYDFQISGDGGLYYPLSLCARRGCDMGEPKNHSESCDIFWGGAADDEDYECDCESFEEKSLEKVLSAYECKDVESFKEAATKFFASVVLH